MNRRFLFALVVVAAALGPAPALAQETSTPTPTPTAGPTVNVTLPNGSTVVREVADGSVNLSGSSTPSPATSTPTPTPSAVRVGGSTNGTTYVAAVSPTLRIVNFSYDRQAERMTILFESRIPDRILVRDALFAAEEEGFAAMPEGRTVNVAPGRTRITVKANSYQGDARVYIEARAGRGVLSTGLEPWNPFDRTSATMGWLGGAGTALAMGVAAAFQQLRKKPKPLSRYDDGR